MLPLLTIYLISNIFLGVKHYTSAKRPMEKIKKRVLSTMNYGFVTQKETYTMEIFKE